MDELAANLEVGFKVSNYPNNPAASHPRFSEYKIKSPGFSDQRVRRQKHLERQKEKRLDYSMLVRRLAEGDWKDIENGDDEEDEEEEEDMDAEVPVRVRRPGRNYRNQLMLSEWMIEKPEDFEANWVMVPCPVGKRSLIIASKGITSVYSKSGILCNRFQSLLPGGNSSSRVRKSILDGIYVENMKTFFILDMMCWGDHPIYDSESEFRLYWMHGKLSETTGIDNIGHYNKFKIIALPNLPCTKDNISSVLTTPVASEIDGLLFYHRQCHYFFGPTPLVLWLKPYMVPDVIGSEVSAEHMSKRPSDYTSFSDHVDKVIAEKERREKERQLSHRGQHSHGRRGRGHRGHRRLSSEPPPSNSGGDQNQSMEVSSLGSQDATTPLPKHRTDNYRHAGKGRGGRGRGTGRGQSQGREDYKTSDLDSGEIRDFGEENSLEECMDGVTSPSGRRRGRHGRNKRSKRTDFEAMDAVDGSLNPT